MGKKIELKVEEIRELYKRRAEINALEFNDIVWTENGQPLEISDELKDFFHFSGFGNFDFIKYFWDEPERVCHVVGIKKEKDDG